MRSFKLYFKFAGFCKFPHLQIDCPATLNRLGDVIKLKANCLFVGF